MSSAVPPPPAEDSDPIAPRRAEEPSGSTGRIETFSDGVFAIAITLLVLDIRVPGATELARDGGLLQALVGEWPSYLSYLAGFATIGAVWLNHHAAFIRIARVDQTLLIWNLLLLLATSFIPFPTKLVADQLADGIWSDSARVAAAFYAIVGIACCLPWVVIYRHVAANPRLLRPPYTSAIIVQETRRGWIGIAGYGVSGLIAVVAPLAALVFFLAGSVFYAATASGLAVDTGRRRRGTSVSP